MKRRLSSLPLQLTHAGQWHKASLLGCSLGCLVAGCAERYDIGAFRNTELQTGDVAPSSAGIGLLLANGIEDADLVLDGVKRLAGATPGDLDGDGFDDLLVLGNDDPDMMQILYGGPRPADGVVHLAGRSSALGLDEYHYDASLDGPRHGDFDRDGANDLALGARDVGSYTVGLTGEAAVEQDAALADLMQRWTDQRALLWYGNPARPARLQFPLDAVAFRAPDNLSIDFARVLEEHAPEETQAQIEVSLALRWLGDVDGDGHGDLALSTGFYVYWGDEAAMRVRTEVVTYLYYGGARLEVGGEAPAPDARLWGVGLAGLGDVDGDGLADMVTVAGDGSPQLYDADLRQKVFAGSAQRLAGEVSAQDLGVPVQLSSRQMPIAVGDLDGDGIGDLFNARVQEGQLSYDLVYGSADLLQRPLDATRVSATFAGRVIEVDMADGGDYDGDGTSDLLSWKVFLKDDPSGDPSLRQPQSDEARLIPGSATRFAGAYDLDASQPSRGPRSGDWYTVLPTPAGDFDGDGRSDVVLTNSMGDTRIKFGAALSNQVIH